MEMQDTDESVYRYTAQFGGPLEVGEWQQKNIRSLQIQHLKAAASAPYRKMTNQVGIPDYYAEAIQDAIWELTRGVCLYELCEAEKREILYDQLEARI